MKLYVREHIPLEQGLRQPRHYAASQLVSGQRAYSIRTRIKTVLNKIFIIFRI